MVFLILHEGRLSLLSGVKGGINAFRDATIDLLRCTYDRWSAIYAQRSLRWIFKKAEVSHESSNGFSKVLKFLLSVS